MTSYYEASTHRDPPFPPLRGTVRADVCIIGAGYTGLMAALELAERGLKPLVLDAGRVAHGASGRNGGQLGSGQRRKQRWLEQTYGKARAQQYWRLAEAAKALAFRRIQAHDISCDLKPGILTVAHREDYACELDEESAHLARHYGYDKLHYLTKAQIEDRLGSTVYHGGLLDMGAAHLHPLQYALGLARAARHAGAVIHENTQVLSADTQSGHVITAQGEVRAEHVILACNGYLGGLAPAIAPYIMPINNHMVATEPLGARARAIIRDDTAVADTRFVIHYFRMSADGRLLFGGGESYSPRMPTHIEEIVRPHLLHVFPQLTDVRIDYAWGGTLAITFARMPHFGRTGKRGYFAHGYSGHGIAMAGLAGKIMAEAITGQPDDFNRMVELNIAPFPGGTMLRNPLRVAAMLYGKMRDAF